MSLWTIADVIQDIGRPSPVGEQEVSLGLLDKDLGIGIGRASEDWVVLMLPGKAGVMPYRGRNVDFTPLESLMDRDSGQRFDSVALLKFRVARESPDVRDAAAAVLVGLVDLEIGTGNAVSAIAQLKELFEGGFKASFEVKTELGLLGELVAIVAASEPDRLIAYWHSDPQGRFDFSSAAGRLEVKATTSLPRRHHFRQRQVIDPYQGEVTFCSVIAAQVEVGDTVASIVMDLSERITPGSRTRVEDIVIKTCKVPSALVTRVKIDVAATISSLALYDRTEIPAPTLQPGVSEVEWVAELREPNGQARGPFVDLLQPAAI